MAENSETPLVSEIPRIRRRIVINLMLFLVFDVSFLWDIPNAKILIMAIIFQGAAFYTGWTCGTWKTIYDTIKNITTTERLPEEGKENV